MTTMNYIEQLAARQERAAQREIQVREIFDNAPDLWDWRRGDPPGEEQRRADDDYSRYLQRRGISETEHEREVGEYLDSLD